jgi:quinol monooxygenase YgiN
MIVVVGKIRTDAERREDLVRVGQAMAQASRAEAGCIDYRLHGDTEDPDAFVFVEEWESQDALDAHFAAPHTATFMQEMVPLLSGAPDVKFHTVASTVDLAAVQEGR